MKKEENKKIPFKNYVIVSIMFILVIAVTLALKEWYSSYKEYKLTIPVISGQLQEINYSNLDNYITEHDDFLLYIGSASDNNCRELEKKLLSILKERKLENDVVYLNITDVKDKTKYLNDFAHNYIKDGKKISYPAFVIMYEKSAVDFITRTSKQELKISDIEKLLDMYEIGD